MRNLKFHYVKAVNILCFGPEGIELHFSDLGNVIQIEGINLDNPGTEDDPASNGAGKSSIQELLSLGLYGKTVRKPTKVKGEKIINCLAKDASVEVQWDDYRVLRTFKRSKTGVTAKVVVWESKDHIWDDDSKLTRSKDDTEAWIEEKVGLSHKSFCNVAIFDDSNYYAFLEMDTPDKREFVENLLDLDQYIQYHENAKKYLKEQKTLVETLDREYRMLQDVVDACDKRIEMVKGQEVAWRQTKQREMSDLLAKVKLKQQQLATTNEGIQLEAWQKAQDRIAELNKTIGEHETKRTAMLSAIATARTKMEAARKNRDTIAEAAQQRKLDIQTIQAELDRHIKLVEKLEALQEGARCPTCHGVISKENYGDVLSHSNEAAETCRSKIQAQQNVLGTELTAHKTVAENLKVGESKVREAESKVSSLAGIVNQMRSEIARLCAVPKPDGNSVQKMLEIEIDGLKKQLKQKKQEYEGDTPFTEILAHATTEKEDRIVKKDLKAKELEDAEKEIPYYEYWVYAFGDKGIRRYVIDGIIPALNSRSGHWLQCLIDNKINVEFNNELDETIIRNGNPGFYENMSNGECRRINLAVSQAWAYIRMLNSGSCPSVVFLDEITGGGIDRAGIVGVYNMIFELAKERQVFVTTHNETLVSMLQGCEKIKLRKQNDITQLVL